MRRDSAKRQISIHAPRTGSDFLRRLAVHRAEFQSTLPARGATCCERKQNKHPCISIHAPRTGSDPISTPFCCSSFAFQSTLPARGATAWRMKPQHRSAISIHAPRTGSDNTYTLLYAECPISIHAPRTGSDPLSVRLLLPPSSDFNPRSPHGERRQGAVQNKSPRQNFNPRSPHGERPHGMQLPVWTTTFQSTLPARGATASKLCKPAGCTISIHAPRTGSDEHSQD